MDVRVGCEDHRMTRHNQQVSRRISSPLQAARPFYLTRLNVIWCSVLDPSQSNAYGTINTYLLNMCAI